ncbi:hypothetical protein Nepgr_002685 [Nepenthes gracilis]|uniref:Uncharacterized protein n=1 Tax=Nepenthes gracilis TaxID=150966 RepID=A0AAD3RYE7_NEPGR|nr:hypothetical protein Nepgr_002685 [Nepenthes gracilis]
MVVEVEVAYQWKLTHKVNSRYANQKQKGKNLGSLNAERDAIPKNLAPREASADYVAPTSMDVHNADDISQNVMLWHADEHPSCPTSTIDQDQDYPIDAASLELEVENQKETLPPDDPAVECQVAPVHKEYLGQTNEQLHSSQSFSICPAHANSMELVLDDEESLIYLNNSFAVLQDPVAVDEQEDSTTEGKASRGFGVAVDLRDPSSILRTKLPVRVDEETCIVPVESLFSRTGVDSQPPPSVDVISMPFTNDDHISPNTESRKHQCEQGLCHPVLTAAIAPVANAHSDNVATCMHPLVQYPD